MSSKTQVFRRSPGHSIFFVLLALLVIVGGSTALVFSRTTISSAASSRAGPEGVLIYNVPNLASASSTQNGKPVDGITCRKISNEVVKYHRHVHVEIFVKGKMFRLPAGIGITKPMIHVKDKKGTFLDVGIYDCLYWLHTHVADGIIHIETPGERSFTLGEFFDIWNQPLGPNQVGPSKGKVVVYENGRRVVGNPRSTPLLPHADIQIDVGTPVVAFQPFHFKVTGGCGQGSTGCSLKKG